MAQLHSGVGDHGDALRIVFASGSVCALALAIYGGYALSQRDADQGRPASAVLLFSAAFGLPACAGLAAVLSDRAGFEPRYLVGALVPLAFLAAFGAFDRALPQVHGVSSHDVTRVVLNESGHAGIAEDRHSDTHWHIQLFVSVNRHAIGKFDTSEFASVSLGK